MTHQRPYYPNDCNLTRIDCSLRAGLGFDPQKGLRSYNNTNDTYILGVFSGISVRYSILNGIIQVYDEFYFIYGDTQMWRTVKMTEG